MSKGGALGVAVVALIFAAAALALVLVVWIDKDWVPNRQDSNDSSGNGMSAGGGQMVDYNPQSKEKTYVFGFESWTVPGNYIDDKGQLKGFVVDLTMAICRNQRKYCAAMYVDNANLCWDSATSFSEGILGGYFVGCVNWLKTQARVNVLSFSNAILDNANLASNLISKSSNGFTTADNKVIGIVASAFSDLGCLRRAGVAVDESKVVRAASNADLKVKLDADEIEFAFTDVPDIYSGDTYSILNNRIICQLGGSGLMTSKANPDLVNWYNAGLQNVMDNGEYEDLCRMSEEKHGVAVPNCL